MRHALGEIRVDAEWAFRLALIVTIEDFERQALSEGGRDDALRKRIEDMLAMIRETLAAIDARSAQPASDLLQVLPRGEDDRGWLHGLHDMLARRIARGEQLTLTCCEHEIGSRGDTLSLAVVHRGSGLDVRPGDTVRAGFAATSSEPGNVEVAPRIYRVDCTNGALTDLGALQGTTCTPESVVAAAESCLSPARFEGSVSRLRRAAGTPVERPERFLAQSGARSRWSSVRPAHELGRDRSVWGLINAVTSSARLAATWAERLRLEADTAGILALLESQPAQRLRALQLELPHAAACEPARDAAGRIELASALR